MIKRRTKRQQQKGRKEPKAKRKLNKRMLKKKTTLKMEIPKLMRYFSSTKAGNRARCAAVQLQELCWAPEGGGSLPHCEDRAAPRDSLQEWPSPSCPVLEPSSGAASWGWLTAVPRIWGTMEPRDIPILQP